MTEITYTRKHTIGGKHTGWYATLGELEATGATKNAAKYALLDMVATQHYEEPRLVIYREMVGLIYQDRHGYGYQIADTRTPEHRPATCLMATTDDMNHAERALRLHMAQLYMTTEDSAVDVVLNCTDVHWHLNYWYKDKSNA